MYFTVMFLKKKCSNYIKPQTGYMAPIESGVVQGALTTKQKLIMAIWEWKAKTCYGNMIKSS